MRWAIEAYERLMWAQANRPDPAEITRLDEAAEREAVNAKIRRRLPPVA